MPANVRTYPVHTSCLAGESIQIAIASGSLLRAGSTYSLRLMEGSTSTPVSSPIPLTAANVSYIASMASHANENDYLWPSISVPTGADWASGFYYAEVLEDSRPIEMSRAWFVVRTPTALRRNAIVVHWPSATAHAYWDINQWGQRANLYDSIHHLRSRRATTQRPLVTADGREIQDGLGTTFTGDGSPSLNLLRWLNNSLRLTFRADVCSSWDLHNDPTTLDRYRLLVLAGHDEYWSREMRDQVESFVRGGGHLAVFSGNSVWWQIRYEDDGRRILCYKSLFEDPLLGSDNSRVTSNWSTQAPGRPENTLTGVGFRYGWMNMAGAGNLTIIPPMPGETPHPALAGVVDEGGAVIAPFGDALVGEADGIDLDFSDPLHPWPTFRDGTPDTFRVLAYNTSGASSLRGNGVMGYYTNGGTVFTAPFTGWAGNVTDSRPGAPLGPIVESVFARITTNVISWLLGRGVSPLMGPSRAINSPGGWTNAGTGPFTALTGNAQGRIFLALGNRLVARHPDLATGEESIALSLPAAGTIGAMGSDLYGSNIYAAVGNRLFHLDVTGNGVNSVEEYTALPASEYFAAVTGVNHENTLYAIAGSAGDQGELRVSDGGGGWTAIGDASGLRALTACDGYLIAATNDNRLVIRLAGKLNENTILQVDETWIDIGAAPEMFALGTYYGRLYGLSGVLPGAELMWRSMVPDPERLPVDFGRLLFYSRNDGSCGLGRFLGNGDYEDAGRFSVGAGWTHVTEVNDYMILFYNSSNGTALLGRVEADNTWTELIRLSGFGRWTNLVSDGDHVVFYGHGSPSGYVGFFDRKTGNYINTDYRTDFSTGWTLSAATWGISTTRLSGRGRYIAFYAPDGTLAICEVDGNGKFHTRGTGSAISGADSLVPAGQLGLLAYNSQNGQGQFGELVMNVPPVFKSINTWPDFEKHSTLGPGRNGLVFFYQSDAGAAIVTGFSRNGVIQELNRWGAADFRKGWSNIIGIHSAPPVNPIFLPVHEGALQVHLP